MGFSPELVVASVAVACEEGIAFVIELVLLDRLPLPLSYPNSCRTCTAPTFQQQLFSCLDTTRSGGQSRSPGRFRYEYR